MNRLCPGIIQKINTSGGDYKLMDNVNQWVVFKQIFYFNLEKRINWVFFFFRFQKACIKYGVPDVDLFQTTDLYDMKNIALVTQTIFAVARAVSIFCLMRVILMFARRIKLFEVSIVMIIYWHSLEFNPFLMPSKSGLFFMSRFQCRHMTI